MNNVTLSRLNPECVNNFLMKKSIMSLQLKLQKSEIDGSDHLVIPQKNKMT